ncbi:MAG: hypothetical protein MO852_06440 [Candidatus Devosia euplotis]|nr:hypothetical protein [Candidatus Devosia euplotis]
MSYLLTPLLALLFVIGLIMAPTPIPLGVPIMAVTVFLLIATNRHAARQVAGLRKRAGWLNRAFMFIEDRAGPRIGRTMRRTRPRG